jgi:hypothetical protein
MKNEKVKMKKVHHRQTTVISTQTRTKVQKGFENVSVYTLFSFDF